MTRIKLNITTEGETELKFVKNTLAIYLSSFDIDTFARSVRTKTGFRGGITTYQKAKNDIQAWLKQNPSSECKFTTMFDLFRKNKSTSGPNVVESIGLSTLKKKCRHFNEWITKLEGLVRAT